MRSRISENTEKKVKTRLVLTVLGTIIILFLIFRYGVNALINFSLFLSNRNSAVQNGNSGQTNNQFISAPILDVSQTATNSASIEIKGSAQANIKILLFKNNSQVDQTTSDNNGSFTFKNENLDKGTNNFTAQAQVNNSKSSFSDPATVTYSDSAPNLTISNPSDNATFSHDQNPIQVTGKTDSNVNVTVNGFIAQTDLNGNFSYTLNLNNGNNGITVDAVDQAGNKTEKTIHVNYNQ